jgi:hypothetical protein
MHKPNSKAVRITALATAAAFALLPMASASAAATISQATAQAVNLNLGSGALTLQVSNPPTAATNDGTQSNAAVVGTPAISLLNGESFLTAGALAETAEANQDGSSYACAGVVGPGGTIQVGSAGQTCSPSGNGTGGVTLDLGALPGASGLSLLAGGDIKITVDAITAHGQVTGTGPATLGADVANIKVQLGSNAPLAVNILTTPNQDLLDAVLTALSPQLGLLGKGVSDLLKPLVSLTTNYQPAPEPNANGTYTVSGLHVALLGTLLVADLAKVTVGPNVPQAVGDAFSFQALPVVVGALALMVFIGFGIRTGIRRLGSAA